MEKAGILIDYMAGRDVACPSCAYSLRDLRTGTCPECGLALRLRVQPLTTRIGPFLVGLLGLSGGVGFSVMFLLFAAYRALSATFRPRFVEMLPLVLCVLLGAPALCLWIARRRRTGKLGWGPAWAIFVLGFGFPAWFLAIAK